MQLFQYKTNLNDELAIQNLQVILFLLGQTRRVRIFLVFKKKNKKKTIFYLLIYIF